MEAIKEQLRQLKLEFKEFLVRSYGKQKDPSASCENTLKYLDGIIEKIIKRQAYRLEFSSGGAPDWHIKVLKYMADLTKLEYRACELLASQINTDDEP